MKHYNLHIKGKVQGVWYRASARRKAEELGLLGFVTNEKDGSVYAEIEGGEAALQAFISWCEQGPELAQVEKVEIDEAPVKGFKTFDIK